MLDEKWVYVFRKYVCYNVFGIFQSCSSAFLCIISTRTVLEIICFRTLSHFVLVKFLYGIGRAQLTRSLTVAVEIENKLRYYLQNCSRTKYFSELWKCFGARHKNCSRVQCFEITELNNVLVLITTRSRGWQSVPFECGRTQGRPPQITQKNNNPETVALLLGAQHYKDIIGSTLIELDTYGNRMNQE